MKLPVFRQLPKAQSKRRKPPISILAVLGKPDQINENIMHEKSGFRLIQCLIPVVRYKNGAILSLHKPHDAHEPHVSKLE